MREEKKREIDELIAAPKQIKKALSLHKVTPEEAERIQEATGIDVRGYKHILDTDGINHVKKGHWEGTEKNKAKPIHKEDFYLIPEIIGNADEITKGDRLNKKKLEVIIYRKSMDGNIYYMEEVRKKSNLLAMATFYKERAKATEQNALKEPSATRSKRPAAKSPYEENIDEGAGDVK